MPQGTSMEVKEEDEKAKRRVVNTITLRRRRGGEEEREMGTKRRGVPGEEQEKKGKGKQKEEVMTGKRNEMTKGKETDGLEIREDNREMKGNNNE